MTRNGTPMRLQNRPPRLLLATTFLLAACTCLPSPEAVPVPTTGSDQYHSPGHHSAGGVGGVGGVGSHYHGGSPAGERGPPPSPNGDNNGPFDWRATSRALSYDADTWTQSWSGAGADTPDPDGQSAGMDMDDDGDSVCEARTRGIRTRTFVSHSRRTHAGMSSPCNTADSTVQEPSVAETGVVRLSDETDPRVPRAMDGLLQLRHVRDSRMVRVESQVLGKGSRRTGTAAHNAQRDARTARQPPADDVLDGVYAPTVPHLPFPLASALDHMQLHERIIHHEINPDHMKGWRPPVHITPAFYRAIMAASQVDTPAGLQASVSRAAEEMTGHGWIHDGPALPLLSEFGGADPNAWVPLTIRFFAETTDDGIAEEEKQQQSTVLGSQPSESDAASITFLNTNQLDIIMLYAQLDDAETALALNSRLVSAGSTLLGTIASPITVHNTDGSATGLEVSERWPVVGLRYWNDHVRMERLDLAPEYGIIDMEVARKAFQHLVAQLYIAKQRTGFVHGSLHNAPIFCRQGMGMHCFVEPAPQRSYFDRQLVHSDSDPDLFDLFDNFAQRMNPSIARVAPFDIDRARSLMNLFLFIRGKPLPLMTYINEMPLTAEPLTYEQLRVIEERRGHGKALHHDIYNDLLLHPFFANAHGHGIGAVLAADDDDTMVDGMPTDMEIAYMEDLTKAAASLMSNGMQGWSFNLKRE